MIMNKDIYSEIVKHINDLSDLQRISLANKTLNTICIQELEQYSILRTLAAYFSRGPDKYHEIACHISKYGNRNGKYKDEADYLLQLKTLIDKKVADKHLYFDLPISILIKRIISLSFIYRPLFIRLVPPNVLKQYLNETDRFGNEYVGLFKYKTVPKDPIWFCGTQVTQTDEVFCFNIHNDQEFLCGHWDGDWPPHFQICDTCRSRTSLCGKCGYYYIDFTEDDESEKERYDDESDYYRDHPFTQLRIKEGICTTGSGYYVGNFDSAFQLFMGIHL